jgi:hypothetical protein
MKFILVFMLLIPLALSIADFIYGQNATNQTNSNSSKSPIDLDPTTWFSLIATTTIAAVVGIPFTLLTNHYQGKRQRLYAIKEAFDILNKPEHRKAREIVYNAFKEYESGQKDIFKSESVKPSAAMVRADLDQIGAFIHYGLIPENIFLELYWNTVLISWKALENDIKYQREKRGYSYYMHYFQQLNESAEIYWKENHPETKEIRIY